MMTSSSTFSSSLQQAASTNIKPHPQNQTTSAGGGFETCFGQGLDLSEFGATTSSPNTTTASANKSSASAALLQVVQRQAFQKQRHEAEEMKLHHTIKQRALNLQHELESSRQEEAPTMAAPSEFETGSRRGANTSTNSNLLTNALISMHGADSFGGKKIKKRIMKSSGKPQQKTVAGLAGLRRGSGSNRTGTSSAAPKKATKKSKRSKHSR
jgi:hypothetical protein